MEKVRDMKGDVVKDGDVLWNRETKDFWIARNYAVIGGAETFTITNLTNGDSEFWPARGTTEECQKMRIVGDCTLVDYYDSPEVRNNTIGIISVEDMCNDCYFTRIGMDRDDVEFYEAIGVKFDNDYFVIPRYECEVLNVDDSLLVRQKRKNIDEVLADNLNFIEPARRYAMIYAKNPYNKARQEYDMKDSLEELFKKYNRWHFITTISPSGKMISGIEVFIDKGELKMRHFYCAALEEEMMEKTNSGFLTSKIISEIFDRELKALSE